MHFTPDLWYVLVMLCVRRKQEKINGRSTLLKVKGIFREEVSSVLWKCGITGVFSTTDMSFSWQVRKVPGPPRDVILFSSPPGLKAAVCCHRLGRLVQLSSSRGGLVGMVNFVFHI